MRVVGPRRLVDALAEWGFQEWRGRLQRPPLASADAEALLTGANTAIWFRAPLVARILGAFPQEHCLRVEVPFAEAAMFHIADGRRLEAWTDAILADRTDDGAYTRALVERNVPVEGALVCTARIADHGLLPPVVIFDGWHRAAVWVAHGRRGNAYPILADIILTNEVPSLLGELQP